MMITMNETSFFLQASWRIVTFFVCSKKNIKCGLKFMVFDMSTGFVLAKYFLLM